MNVKKVLDKNIAATLLLICCICTFFVLAASQVNRLATDACFDTLDDATAQAAVNIRAQVESDRKQLDVIASLLAQHDTLDSEILAAICGPSASLVPLPPCASCCRTTT